MSLQVENLEKNMAKLTVEVPAEKFEEAIKTAYNKNKNRFATLASVKVSTSEHDREDVRRSGDFTRRLLISY